MNALNCAPGLPRDGFAVKIQPPYCTEIKNMLSYLHQPARLGLSGA